MKNIVIVVLVIVSGLFLLYAFQQKSEAEKTRMEIEACQVAAQESSAEAFIMREQAEKHRAEAEEHRQAAEEHKKIADDALEQVEKLKR